MVRRGDRDGLHVRVVEERPHVGVLLRREALGLADDRGRAFPGLLVHVADRGDARSRDVGKKLQVLASSAARANHG